MKKTMLIIYFVWVGLPLVAQTFPKLKIEKIGIDKNNQVYQEGSVWAYEFLIEKDDTFFRIKNSSFDQFALDTTFSQTEAQGTLSLYILNGKFLKRTNPNQTQIGFLVPRTDTTFSVLQTGLVENKHNVWIHPPRYGFFNCLQTGPYPYVKLPLEVGKTWSDDFRIGSYYANPAWQKWENSLLMHLNYSVVDEVTLDTDLGKIICFKISSQAVSEVATTQHTFYYSEKYGFVRMEYAWGNGLRVTLKLKQRAFHPEIETAEDIFENLNKE